MCCTCCTPVRRPLTCSTSCCLRAATPGSVRYGLFGAPRFGVNREKPPASSVCPRLAPRVTSTWPMGRSTKTVAGSSCWSAGAWSELTRIMKDYPTLLNARHPAVLVLATDGAGTAAVFRHAAPGRGNPAVTLFDESRVEDAGDESDPSTPSGLSLRRESTTGPRPTLSTGCGACCCGAGPPDVFPH